MYHFTALVTLLALAFYFFTCINVSRSRTRTGVKVPAMSGHPDFERAFRIQMSPKATAEVAGHKLPVEWQIAIPSRSFSIQCKPLNPKAWMGTGFSYWEGPISFAGTHDGVGYLELTGY